MQDLFGFRIASALQQQIRLPVAPLIFFFGFHWQTRQPGIQATTIAGSQRHAHPALHKRGGVGAHNRIITPFGLLVGNVIAHQTPGDNVAQLLGLLVIKLLRLHQGRDHQAGILHILTRHAGKGDRRHLSGEIRCAGGASKGHYRIRIVGQRDDR